MMTGPTLSVVMPNYNHAHYLPRSIKAIAEQTRPPDEFLILDDASTDNSVEIIAAHAERYPCIRLIRNQRNAGVNLANERLFGLATGTYLHPAAADDDRSPTFFEKTMTMAARYPHAGLIFGQVLVKNEADQEIGRVGVRQWNEVLYANPRQYLDEYLEIELASHSASPATIYRRDAFDEVGRYRTELGPWADTFAARAIGLKYGAVYIPEQFATDYRLPGSYSQEAKRNPRYSIDVIAHASSLMRSPEFRERFPADHVRRWERRFRRLVAWNYLLDVDRGAARRPFVMRNLARLPRVAPAVGLLWYQGKPACPS